MSVKITSQTRAVYRAEDRVERWRALGSPISLYGSVWDVEAETYFTRERAQDLLDQFSTRHGTPPVRLVATSGKDRASYNAPGRIRIPAQGWGDDAGHKRISLLVLTHEFTHHLIHHTRTVAGLACTDMHDEHFIAAHLDVLRDLDQPVTATLLRIAVDQEKDTTHD